MCAHVLSLTCTKMSRAHIVFGRSLLSYEIEFQINSEYLLRRYLPNNTDVCLILNFLCIFFTFSKFEQ